MRLPRVAHRAVPVGLLAVALSATPALSFGPTTVVDSGNPGHLITATDLVARGQRIAIASSREDDEGPRGVVLSWSADGGSIWQNFHGLDRDWRDPRVTVCAGHAVMTYTDEFDAGRRDVMVTGESFAGGPSTFSRLTVGYQTRKPDITCLRNQELAVAWFQQSDSGWRVQVRAWGLTGSGSSPQSFDLGKGTLGRGLAIAASSDRLYVTWFQGNKLQLRRFKVGPAPDNTLTSLGTKTIATLKYGSVPRIGADGTRAFLAYMDKASLKVRRSTNKGGSFAAAKTLRSAPFPSEIGVMPTTVAVKGTRAVIGAVEVGGIETLTGKGRGYLTTNGGTTWKQQATHSSGQTVAGLVTVDGTARYGEAWDQSITQPETQRIRFRRK
ncbi:MAG: hypothetical protein KF809_06245 [Chloroflexi bacterium]|nr:hypothetical protein [Chloroflexota bacterium]